MRSSAARVLNVVVACVFGAALAVTGASAASADDATHTTSSTTVTPAPAPSPTQTPDGNYPWN